MTREWPSVGLLPTEKGKQFFSSAPPHKFHTVMKNVAVWNIALRLTVTQLISVLVPSLRLYSSTVAGSQPIVRPPMVRLTIEQQVGGTLALLGHIAILFRNRWHISYLLETGHFLFCYITIL